MAGTGKAHLRNSPDVILRVEDLLVEFPVGRTGLKVNAVSGISFYHPDYVTAYRYANTGTGSAAAPFGRPMAPAPAAA